MSEETNQNTNQNTTQQPTTQPEDNGNQGSGKMFTQDDVNRIVSERLARDRKERTTQTEADEKEQALKARESKLDCREYLSEKKYPAELLEVLDTSDVEKFKAAADKIQEMYGLVSKGPRFVEPPRFAAPMGGNRPSVTYDPVRDAFKPKA